MRAAPFLHCKFIPMDEISIFECSDRILIPKSIFVSMGFGEGPILLNIANTVGTNVRGVLYNIHEANDDIIYMPTWMSILLSITDNLSMSSIKKFDCSRIIIRPQNAELLKIPDWNVKFSESIKYYNTLTQGYTIPVIIDDKFMYVTIDSLNDRKHETYFLTNGVEIGLEVLESQETKKARVEEPIIPFLYFNPRKKRKYIRYAFSGEPFILGTKPTDTNLSRPHLCKQAALDRIERERNRGLLNKNESAT